MRSRLMVPALACALLFTTAASAADKWLEAGSGAVAILPDPKPANGIVSGTLFCIEQKWAFHLRTVPNTLAASVPAKVTINGQLLALEAKATADEATIALPHTSLAPLKAGNSLAIEIGPVETGVAAVFNLRGSRTVIEAIAPRCSHVDMSPYEPVALSDTDPAVEQARILVANEIKLFRAATGRLPTVRAHQLSLVGQKSLLFAAVCGSTNYYGASGCNLTGYTRVGDAGEWKMAYNTEGVLLYLNAATTHDGWPGLATLPVVNGFESAHWVWNGSAYVLRDVEVAGEQDASDDGKAAE